MRQAKLPFFFESQADQLGDECEQRLNAALRIYAEAHIAGKSEACRILGD